MKTFIVVATLCVCALADPGYEQLAYGAPNVAVAYGAPQTHVVATGPAQAHVVAAGPPVAQVSESYHPGPVQAHTHVEHGVVGHRTIQVGSQPVQVGHEFYVAGQEVHQPAAYSVVASPAVNTQNTRPIAPPALPHAAAPSLAIPPRPVNYGPAPADTVTQERILAPVRTHTVVTPRRTRIEPELHVNKYAVEVPVEVPVPVHREVLVEKRVNRPYNVPVPRAVPVPRPYKVHPVHEVVETPVVREHTVSVHQNAPLVAHHGAYAAPAYAGAYAAPAAYAGIAAVEPIAAAAVKAY